ncbi:TerC family protein [Anoxybacterium hadale]|uniref:TerC family protein n=1 Tax=Anoxybacterium hadale TaxID=3408580 RepID=A0ACD1A7K8_9FIRM|nr:TerC family protein [Clostridiales bacterium]
MEILGLSITQFLTGILSIVMIDLVLAGDNAIVIGLACRNLPKHMQLKAICLGTAGAIVIRVLATLVIVWLLQLKGLMLGGGALLIWIAYKLLAKPQNHDDVKCYDSLLSAVVTIIVADAVMGIDNILAIAGASHGSYVMVVIGLAISIPIMVFGSTLIIRLMEKFPIIIDFGAAVIAYTAGNMITEEPLLHHFFLRQEIKYALIGIIILGVLVAGRRMRRICEAASDRM